MKSRSVKTLLVCCLIKLISCQAENPQYSTGKVINGMEEAGFSSVIQFVTDLRTLCSGSFVSDSLLLTAAHCLDRANSLTWKGIKVERHNFMIHPGWPTTATDCSKPRHPGFDVALVKFPDGSFTGEFSPLLKRVPEVGEEFLIVGYGNNLITPFERFCTLPARKLSDGLCHVLRGERSQGADYQYSSLLAFEPEENTSTVACQIDCPSSRLLKVLEAQGISARTFVDEHCDGNFRDRSYQSQGLGTKRMGFNRITKVYEDGLLEFFGGIGGSDDGFDVASDGGDSGGPLLILDQGQYKIAAITHGGSLHSMNGEFRKRSIYVVLHTQATVNWLTRTVKEKKLNFPDFK